MKIKIAIVAAALVGAILLIFGWPVLQQRNLEIKYPMGTPLEEIQSRLTSKHTLTSGGVVFPNGPSENDKELYSFFNLEIPAENVRLEFNFHRKLIGIRMRGHPISSAWKRFWNQS